MGTSPSSLNPCPSVLPTSPYPINPSPICFRSISLCSLSLRDSSEAIKTRRIVDQNAVAHLFVRHPVEQEIEKSRRFWHWAGNVDMRPVRTPKNPIGPSIQQRFDQRDHVAVGRRLVRAVIAGRQFRPAPSVLEQPQQSLQCRLGNPVAR